MNPPLDAPLDLRDRKLAFLLSRNCRTSFHNLGKALGLSPDSVRYRLEKLERQGVIRGYIVVPNTFAQGKVIDSVFVSFRSLSKESEHKALELLNQKDEVVFAYKTQGAWDLVFQVEHKNVFDLHKIMEEFRALCGEEKIDAHFYQAHVGEYKFRQAPEIILGGQKVPDALPAKSDASFAKDFLEAPPIELFEQAPAKISESDWRVLNALSGDARVSLTDLARKTGLSVDQVRYKIRGLVREGIIQAFWAVLDLEKFGLQRFDLLVKLKSMDAKAKERMKTYFLNHPHVVRAILAFGPYDLWVNLACEDLSKCHQIVQELSERFASHLLDADMLMVFEELKFEFKPGAR